MYELWEFCIFVVDFFEKCKICRPLKWLKIQSNTFKIIFKRMHAALQLLFLLGSDSIIQLREISVKIYRERNYTKKLVVFFPVFTVGQSWRRNSFKTNLERQLNAKNESFPHLHMYLLFSAKVSAVSYCKMVSLPSTRYLSNG